MDPEILAAALVGLELKKARLEEKIASLRALVGGKPARKTRAVAESTDDWEAPAAAPKAAKEKKKVKRILSPEARERIAAAQKKRWAAARGEA